MKANIKHLVSRYSGRLLSTAVVTALAGGYVSNSYAGATFKIDDTKWVSVGAGLRTSFTAKDGGTPDGKDWNNDFNLNNVRLYVNGQIHKYLKIEFNTECQMCGTGGDSSIQVLDAIGKFDLDSRFNVWVGRMLVPAERRELNGPFYSPIFSTFGAGTPFEPSDYSLTVKNDGTSAGATGRDDGVNIWGAFFDKRLQYVVGFFRGLRGGSSANQSGNILYAQRLAYNFWDVEKNPGYYTSGTYYGKGGDILTVGVSNQYQDEGAGTIFNHGSFRGTTVDVLLEKVLGGGGVVTLNGEYKNYGISGNYSPNIASAPGLPNFNMFEGNAYDVSGMYLFPQKIWIGQAQPYLRYVNVDPTASTTREVYEAGMNYIIDGHNAKVSLSYQYGDLLNKGLNYTTGATGDRASQMMLGFQWQI